MYLLLLVIWLEVNTTMAEFDHNDQNPICDFVRDIQNLTDDKLADAMLILHPEVTLLMRIFIPMVFVIGCIGNVSFLLLLGRVKMMRTITNIYLANLAVADLMVLSMQTFFESWRFIDFKQVISEPFHTNAGCGMTYFMRFMSSCASTLLITLVGFDRYFAVCHPVKYRIKKNKRQVCVYLTLLAWAIAATYGLLGWLNFSRLGHHCILWPSRERYKYLPKVIKLCAPMHPIFQTLYLPVYNAIFITAVITNSIINIQIVKKLKNPPPGENGNQQNQQIKRRITLMFLVNSVVFCCCMTPINLFTIMYMFNISRADDLIAAGTVFLMINSAVNPIVYGVISPRYRRGFLKAFGFGRNQIEPRGNQVMEATHQPVD